MVSATEPGSLLLAAEFILSETQSYGQDACGESVGKVGYDILAGGR